MAGNVDGGNGRAVRSSAAPAHFPFRPCMMMPMRFSGMTAGLVIGDS